MNCFPCFSSQKSKKQSSFKGNNSQKYGEPVQSNAPVPKKQKSEAENVEAAASRSNHGENVDIEAKAFTFRDLAAATKNFRQECVLGEGGFGKVYKGTLRETGQVVAVKQIDRNAMLENKDFLAEVAKLSRLQHPNLVNLIGYCADGDQRLLVYEFMPQGSVEDHLHGKNGEGSPLDWITRMKIAYGAAQALEFLHDKIDTPVIYRDLKSSNVLLDEKFNPKLSDIGLDKLEPSTDKMPLQSREMGTYGYSAPEYSRSGRLTPVSDVYSFGVVLLEIVTGKKVIDTTKPVDEQNLVSWAQAIFKEPKRYRELADPLLKKRYPERDLNQAVGITAMCLQDEAGARPMMSDLVTALSFLSMATPESCNPPAEQESESAEESDDNNDDDDDDDGNNSSGSRSSSGSARSRSRRSNDESSSREEISSNGGNDDSSRRKNHKKSQSSLSRNCSEKSEGSSGEDRMKSAVPSIRKSSCKKEGDGSVSKSRKSRSSKASRSADGSLSSASSRKSSRRSKKVNKNEQSRTGVSQDGTFNLNNYIHIYTFQI